MAAPRRTAGVWHFAGHPEFRPSLSPRELFRAGAFGGTYWRPIRSAVTGRAHTGAHRRLPADWWRGIDESLLASPKYDKARNCYGVKVGTTLEYWESKGWITAQDPYGWVQWYCHFFAGRRSADDARQIQRWQGVAGPTGRFRRRLANMVRERRTRVDDPAVSPGIRQTLLHWAYQLQPGDI